MEDRGRTERADVQRRTLLGWFEHLDARGRELTLEEFQAVMVFNTREWTRLILEEIRQMRQAAEHTEGMVGAIDQFAAGLAERSGIPYASSGSVRAALDKHRDEQRRLAAEERSRALKEAADA